MRVTRNQMRIYGVETVNEFCYLGDKLKTSEGYEAAVTARMRIGWIKFRVIAWKKIFINDQSKGFSELCLVGTVVWQRNTMFKRKRNGHLEKNRNSNGESNVWCQTSGQENTEDKMDMLELNQTIN